MRQNHDVRDVFRSEILAHKRFAKRFELRDLIFVSGHEEIFGQLDVESRAQLSRVDEMKEMTHHRRLYVGNFHHVQMLNSGINLISKF